MAYKTKKSTPYTSLETRIESIIIQGIIFISKKVLWLCYHALIKPISIRTGIEITWRLYRLRKTIPIMERKKHIYISGATGSGKSELMRLLIHDQIVLSRTYKHSIVVIDPHGDLSHQIKRSKLVLHNKKFTYFEPELISGYTPIINPLELPFYDRKNVVVHAQNLANAIEEVVGVDLSVNMGALLIPCLSLLMTQKYADLLDLIKLLHDDPHLIAQGRKLPIKSHRYLFEHFDDPLYTKTKSSIFTKLQAFLNYPAFYNATIGHSTIDIRKSINTGKLLVFNLSQRFFGPDASQAYGRFIISLIKSAITMRGQYRKPTYLFVDECQNFLSPSFTTILEQSRKFGLHLIMANQSMERLGRIQDTILTNTATKLIGRTDSIKTMKKMHSLTGAGLKTFQQLRNYQFYTKISGRP